MSKSANCELIAQTNRSNSYGTAQRGVGYNGTTYYDYRLKLKTPDFNGDLTSISFNLSIYNKSYKLAVFHWALCTSDENHDMYKGNMRKKVPDDPYQIATGVFRCNNINVSGNINTLTISADALSQTVNPQTEYYLYLWCYENTGEGIYITYATVGSLEKNSASIEYNLRRYTVYFNSNGVGTAPAEQSVEEGGSITLPTMSANGYLFFGWATSSTATSGVTGSYSPTSNVTLYAVWKKAYTVTFDTGGVCEEPSAITVAEGSSISLPSLSADGYVFVGWATDSTATSGMTGNYRPVASLTLYAVWKRILTVSFDTNGFGEAPQQQTVLEGDSITLPDMAGEGWEFLGWATDSAATSGMTGTYTPTASVTLYAIWAAIYTVRFQTGHGVAPATQAVEDGDSIILPEMYVEGYRFCGWSDDPYADYGETGEYWPSESVTLYAIWVAVYTVRFETEQGERPEEQTVEAGEGFELPVLEVGGSTFLGWSEDPEAKAGVTGWYYPERSVVLYAVWKKNGSRIYVCHGGEKAKCVLFVNHNGEPVRCALFKNVNGKAVKI